MNVSVWTHVTRVHVTSAPWWLLVGSWCPCGGHQSSLGHTSIPVTDHQLSALPCAHLWDITNQAPKCSCGAQWWNFCNSLEAPGMCPQHRATHRQGLLRLKNSSPGNSSSWQGHSPQSLGCPNRDSCYRLSSHLCYAHCKWPHHWHTRSFLPFAFQPFFQLPLQLLSCASSTQRVHLIMNCSVLMEGCVPLKLLRGDHLTNIKWKFFRQMFHLIWGVSHNDQQQ